MNKEELKLEQDHLTSTYNKLLDMRKDLEDKIVSLDEKAMEDMGTFKVGREYMDDNGHMNNIKYLEHVEACIPELESGMCILPPANPRS